MSHPTPPEHPFAPYVRALGKGPRLSRPLTLDEARAAAGMIMEGAVEPVQLGAFLCLLRVRTETPEEVAGLALGIRDALPRPPEGAAEIDWSSYAGKSRQLPYYLLAALALAQGGARVLMHGAEGHTDGRVYTSQALATLGLSPAASLGDAARRLERDRFAYLPLPVLSPTLQAIMDLKPLLGVRSPLHTVGRLLNPFAAPFSINAVTHPPYLAVHQQAAGLLGQRFFATFKGDGGEVERRPEKATEVLFLAEGQPGRDDWPARLTGARPRDETMDLDRLGALWRGEAENEEAEATIAGTLAIALRYSGRAGSIAEAEARALDLWRGRDKTRLPGGA